MELVLLGVAAVAASVTAFTTGIRAWDARRAERTAATTRLRELRRGFYDDAKAGRLDNPRSRAELRDAGFSDRDVDFIAGWKVGLRRYDDGAANSPELEAMKQQLHHLLLEPVGSATNRRRFRLRGLPGGRPRTRS